MNVQAMSIQAIAAQPKAKESVHMATLRRLSLTGMSLIALFGGTIGVWAAVSTLSGAVVAPAQFVVDSSGKKIQHSVGGIVGELRVREGDRVKEGDILIRLDETMTRANLQIVSKQLDELLVHQARLEAERDGATAIETPPELASRLDDRAVAKLVNAEKSLFE